MSENLENLNNITPTLAIAARRLGLDGHFFVPDGPAILDGYVAVEVKEVDGRKIGTILPLVNGTLATGAKVCVPVREWRVLNGRGKEIRFPQRALFKAFETVRKELGLIKPDLPADGETIAVFKDGELYFSIKGEKDIWGGLMEEAFLPVTGDVKDVTASLTEDQEGNWHLLATVAVNTSTLEVRVEG